MGHPVFVIEWDGGRRFLIDAGMTRAEAEAFGKPIESILGSEPIEPHGPVSEQLADAVGSVAGIAFTHLHIDHTEGVGALCEALNRPLPVYQTADQADRSNYTTAPGNEAISGES